MKKIIGINALFMIPNKVGGTEYHLRSFMKYLEKNTKDDEFVLFCNKENFDTFSFNNNNWRKILCPISASNRLVRVVYEQTLFPMLVQNEGCSILHSFGYFGPVWGNFKKVVTVHDTNWKDFPEDTSKLQNTVLNFLITQSIKTAETIVTDSDFSVTRLAKYFPAYTDKTVVIYPGIEDTFIQNLRKKTNHPLENRKYVLCVSALYPHKKILYLLDLWQAVHKQHPSLSLVLIGTNGSQERAVASKVRDIQSVRWHRKVSYADLLRYYQHATAAIFPSVYEGFGYPAYEAVSAGLPLLVGKKNLYHPQLRKFLGELTFRLAEDVTLFDLLLKQSKHKQQLDFINYNHASKQLLQIYSNLHQSGT